MSTTAFKEENAKQDLATGSEEELQKSISATESSHPVLTRLRQKIQGRPADSSILTDYSRMHHRHNRD